MQAVKLLNAVAPDWNLKFTKVHYWDIACDNAVAPDWNLKATILAASSYFKSNAVAPDWNLKLFDNVHQCIGHRECSRTRLEFKVL